MAAGVLHAVWNAITKSVHDRMVVLGWLGAAALVSGAIGVAVVGVPGRTSTELAVLSAVLHLVYYVALTRAYQLGAFNQMYPVARGTSPLLVAAGGAVFAGEGLGGLELAGVIVLAAGLLSLAASNGRIVRSEVPALRAALATGVMIASYTLVDGLGVRHAHDPFSYIALSFLLEGTALVIAAVVRRRPAQLLERDIAWRGVVAGVLSVIAYAAIMWAQTKAPLAVVAALRETGVISGAIIGAVVFKEGFGSRRVAAAVVVALGIVLIGI